MIRLSDRLWIGNSGVTPREVRAQRITSLLNVAQDLRGEMGWPDIEYTQVGLIDGPGNPLSAYYAAALSLWTILKKRRTLVFCHTGSRSLAVAIMCMNITAGHSWDGIMSLLSESVDVELPTPHEEHRTAFEKMDWDILRELCR